jgi:hypothetical protein
MQFRRYMGKFIFAMTQNKFRESECQILVDKIVMRQICYRLHAASHRSTYTACLSVPIREVGSRFDQPVYYYIFSPQGFCISLHNYGVLPE